MTRNGPGDTDGGPGDKDEKEIIRLARDSAELHYSHEIDIDIDAACTDIRRRIPGQAPPPLSRLRQARVSISHAWRQVPWNWRALIRSPYAILFILAIPLVTATIIILVYCFKPLAPGTRGADRVVGSVGTSITSSHTYHHKHLVADKATRRHVHGHTERTGTADGQLPLPPHPADTPANGKILVIDITAGGKTGSLVSLDVAVTGAGSGGTELTASLGIAVDPSAAACSLSRLGTGDPGIPRLLAALKAPVRLEVQVGPRHSLAVQLSPTGVPAQPLSCSVLNSDTKSGTPAASGSSAWLSGTVGTILGSVSSIPLLP